eukprot:scaffold66816_cov52-Phaeocystis_antarctica.AAC.4
MHMHTRSRSSTLWVNHWVFRSCRPRCNAASLSVSWLRGRAPQLFPVHGIMRALGRPLLNNWLCLLSAATQQHALVMHAGSGRCIPELRDIYELAPLMTYDGWEGDVGYVERRWANDGQVDIQSEVGRMRRKQCLHEGDRSDAALQVLNGVKLGLTYPGWEED